MLATLVDEPFHRPGWVYEEKYDGYRILAYKEGDRVTLLSRNGKNRTETFADVAQAIATLPDAVLLLDGEVVAFDRKLVSRFQLLQQGEVPQVYAVFDCLYRNGKDLRGEPLPVRRAAARGSDRRRRPALRLAPAAGQRPQGLRARDEEGLGGTGRQGPGGSRTSRGAATQWLKVKVHQEEELVIGGLHAARGIALPLRRAAAGRVSRARAALRREGRHRVHAEITRRSLQGLPARSSGQRPRSSNPPREKGAVWLAPKLVAQVNFQEWTDDGKLRQPVFLGLRDDKKAEECVLPEDIP